MAANSAQRVIAYIDGFNLYFGINEANLRRYLWLNVHELAKRLLFPHQVLGVTKYFTARISGARPTDNQKFARKKDAKRKRQTNYLDAIGTIPQIQVFEGQYRDKIIGCDACGKNWNSPEEKMTDVNIATELLADAFENAFDTAILISGDSDLVPPVRKIRKLFPHKRVIVAFPPSRASTELAGVASGQFHIANSHLKKSQFPDTVDVNGFKLKRPGTWV